MVVSSILGTKIGGLWVGSNIMCFGCYFRSFKHCCWLDTLWHQHWSLMPTHPPTLPHLSEHLVKFFAIKSKIMDPMHKYSYNKHIKTIHVALVYGFRKLGRLWIHDKIRAQSNFQSRKDIIKMLTMLKNQ